MKRSLERNLEIMLPSDREVAIQKLRQIKCEIEKYSQSFFWQGHGRTRWSTEIEVQLGADVIRFSSSYHESYRNCYYSKSLTFNGKKTTCLLVNNIISKLQELNAAVEQESIFLDEDIFL